MPSDYEQIKKDNIFEYGNATHHLELLSAHYTNRTHFVFELLQNAEDAKASRILFTLYDDRLEVTHDGRVFNEQDVKGICGVGEGTKADDLTQIGKFGIGFKSVYVYTSAPAIFSGEEHFRIEHYVRPFAVEPIKIEEPWTTRFVLPFDREDFNSEIAFQEIGERLRNLNSMAILFLRNIKEIEFRLLDAYGVYRRHDINAAGHMRQVAIGTERENWLIFERPILVPDRNHQVRVEIAFKLETDLVGTIEGIRQIHESPLFVYFPTERDTRLSFLIQGPYRTTLARDNIPSDDTWNKQLIVETATLIVESMHRLKEMDLLTVSLLEALPVRVEDFAQGGLFHPIFSRAREAFINEELLPANDGTFVSAPNAKLARGDAVRNLLSDEQLGDLFEASDEVRWLSGEITENRTHDLWHYFRDELEIEEVDPEMFVRRLSEQFLVQQCDEWFIDFYKFLTGQRSLWSSPWSTLRSKPILRLQDGTHVNPPRGDGSSPSAYLASEVDTDMPSLIINVELAQDEEVRNFLRELGVREREIVDDVIEHILPKYECDTRTILVEEHRTDFEKIRRAYNTDSQTNRTRLRDRLLQTPFILTEDTHTERPIYCKPNQLYFASDELRLYFEGNDSRAFVDLDEYPDPDSARELLEGLEEMAIIRVEKRRKNVYGHIVVRSQWGCHVRGLDEFDPGMKVDGLEHAINHPTPEKSAFIWNNIAKPYSNCIRGDVESSTNQEFKNSSREERPSYDFGRLLIDTPWLPDSTGQMHRPRELTLDDLPESFVRDANLAEKLGLKKDEVAELAEKTGIPLKVIEVLKKPGMSERFEEFLARESADQVDSTSPISSNPAFPKSPVKNPERRAAMLAKELGNLPDKEYKQILRSVRVHSATETARVRFRIEYTNDDEQMICQICQNEMPFKKRDGEYYFEAVEALNKENFTKELEAQFLALCPECAARYQEFIKKDEVAMQAIIDRLMASTDFQVQLQLGELNTNLRFVEKHWRDIKQILESA